MSTAIFINLHVKNPTTSADFFVKTGFALNKDLTGDEAACVVIGDNIFVLLVTESFFKDGSKKAIVDTSTHSEAMLAVQVESRARVDELADAAIAAGGTSTGDPSDEGFMYSRGFLDLDGHVWAVLSMEETS